MRDLLTKHDIPDTTISAAVEFLNSAPDDAVESFTKEFGLSLNRTDTLSAGRFAADAILRGADSVDKVRGYIAKRMLGSPAPPVITITPVTLAGIPSVDNSLVTVTPMVMDEVPSAPIKGKRGRPKSKAFANAATLLDGLAHKAERAVMLDCLVAAGINKSSAAVYVWRYNKGLRE